MVRVNEPNISKDKSVDANIQAIKTSMGEVVDALNYLSAQVDGLLLRVNTLESED